MLNEFPMQSNDSSKLQALEEKNKKKKKKR